MNTLFPQGYPGGGSLFRGSMFVEYALLARITWVGSNFGGSGVVEYAFPQA